MEDRENKIIYRQVIVPSSRPQPVDLLDEITEAERWQSTAQAIVGGQEPPFSADRFSSHWIAAGRRIREQIGNDLLLRELLRRALPPYAGAAVTLFRGENLNRLRSGVVGFAWTSDIKIARMFGSGLNAVHDGGVLLECKFEPTAIISGPSTHSIYLGEQQFTIDPFCVTTIEELERFPPL